MFHKVFETDINYISFIVIHLNELVPGTFLNRHKVKTETETSFEFLSDASTDLEQTMTLIKVSVS